MAAVAIETSAPPSASDADNLAERQAASEANNTLVATEPPVEATVGGGDALASYSKKDMPPPSSTERHETEAPATVEASEPAASPAGGDAAEVSVVNNAAARPWEIIDLNGPNLSCRDPTSFKAVLERLLVGS
jgi:hypothetical protein